MSTRSLIHQVQALSKVPWPVSGMPPDTAVLFAPRDDVRSALLLVLRSAKVSVKVQMFALTDGTVNATLRGLAGKAAPFEFQMSLDSIEATTNAAMVPVVAGWVGDARVVTGTSARGNYSHSKVAVVDHLYVVGGSTNWSTAGQAYEDNEFVVRRHAGLAAWYEAQMDAVFARMVSRRKVMLDAGLAFEPEVE